MNEVLINTTNYLKQFTTPNMLSSKNEDLVKSYQITKDDRLISALFVKLINITDTITSQYTKIEPETSTSFILKLISDIALDFDTEKNAKFSTYYQNCLKRLMFGLYNPYRCKKRQGPEPCSLSEPVFSNGSSESHSTLGDTISYNDSNSRIDFELYESLHNVFDDITAEIFICLSQGYSRTEIADILNVNLIYVCTTIRKHKNELADLLLK